MKESSLMILHYITGFLILVLGAVHLATHSFLGVEGYSFSLQYVSSIERYRNPIFALTLELLLVNVAYHGLNGTRVVLLELKQGELWDKIINWLILLLGILIVAYGTRTILTTYFFW
jgi:succinate dehydrogenase / fumarate reductase membrane anchor subunit